MNIKLNKFQRTVFLMAAIIILSISIFWSFIYGPARESFKKVKDELAAIQSDIYMIEEIAGGEKNLDVAYKKFYEKYSGLQKKITTEERSVLSALSREADRMKIKVIFIKPERIRTSALPLSIDGRPLLEMPVLLSIRCGYKTLGEYLGILRELPALIAVDKIYITRAESEVPSLDIMLNIIIYILSE